MLNFHSQKPAQFCDGVSRRDFLRVGALSAGAVGLTLADTLRMQADTPSRSNDINCIMLFLVGGPSHLDTWDLKPDAPENVRGPFRPIRTNVPGIDICEHFPLMAKQADQYALLRSVHHKSAPIHETGHQMMQTGYLNRAGIEYPHYGSVVSHLKGRTSSGLPPFMILPTPIGNTGVSVSHGQSAGYLGPKHEPVLTNLNAAAGIDPARHSLVEAVDGLQRTYDVTERVGTRESANEQAFSQLFAARSKRAFDIDQERSELRDRYGRNTFGQSCLQARRLVESGVRFVTVNMFDTVFSDITWDMHADGGSLNVNHNDYKETLCPMFDAAYSTLLNDLKQRGMLDNTLVVAMGEFGRTPLLNPRGGRDHWPGAWTILFAGGKVKGGQVIGSSDQIGAAPKDRPITPPEVAATIYQGLGIDLDSQLPGPDGRPMPLVDAKPIVELF